MTDEEVAAGEGDVVPAEIASLLDRRTTIRGWLEGVDERADEVRPEVLRRVREDYEGRLREVEEELMTHRADLERSLETRRATLAELRERRESREADLEEARLRHSVGEYEDDDWESRRTEHEEELEEIGSQIEEEAAGEEKLAAVLDELRELDEGPPGTASADGDEAGAPLPEEREEVEAVREPEETSDLGDSQEPVASGGAEDREPQAEDREPQAEDREPQAELEPAPEPETAPEPERSGQPDPGRAEVSSGLFPSGGEDGAGAEEVEGDEETAREERTEYEEETEEYEDELEFLESLSLDDTDALDTFSLDLEDEDEDPDDGSDDEKSS